jgi:hypothetical protein
MLQEYLNSSVQVVLAPPAAPAIAVLAAAKRKRINDKKHR